MKSQKKPKFQPKKTIFRLLSAVVILYTILFFVQGHLLFQSGMANAIMGKLKTPAEYNLSDFSEAYLQTADNVKIMGWSHSPQEGKPIILYFHGNASHIAMRMQRYTEFVKAGYGVFALSYRGYGKSEGSPSEQGLYSDARAAIAWINNNYKSPKIILYGESLGSGVAVEMAKEYPVQGVVLQSAYSSMDTMASETYWFLPFIKYLVTNHFDSLSKIADIHTPVLIFHGDNDNVIPLEQGKQLAEKANEPKKFVVVQGAGHMDIPDEIILKNMKEFFQ